MALLLAAACAVRATAASNDGFDSFNADGLIEQARRRTSAPAGDGLAVPNGVPVPVPVLGLEVPKSGHSSAYVGPTQYNIWSRNCHSEANFFTANAALMGLTAGILACQGDPVNSPQYHTANWVITQSGETCIYNWGTPCCWIANASPPEIATGPGLACAKSACGPQYVGDPNREDRTRAMPAGKLVESPTSSICAISAAGGPLTLFPGPAIEALSEHLKTGAPTVRSRSHPGMPNGAVLTFSADRLDPCLECCAQRTALWSSLYDTSPSAQFHTGRRLNFLRQCNSACRHSFQVAPDGR